MMRGLREIKHGIQLLVEGADADYFFSALVERLGIAGIQIQDFGGINDLRGFLKQLRRAPGFGELVKTIAVVRDAEQNPGGAFQSVQGALKGAELAVPERPEEFTESEPRTGVFILPNADESGMLETICLSSVYNDPAMPCILDFMKCLQDKLETLPNNLQKTKLQAFLASREKVPRMLGLAAKQGVWPWDSVAFEGIKNFLRASCE